jgi:hypothetical protein
MPGSLTYLIYLIYLFSPVHLTPAPSSAVDQVHPTELGAIMPVRVPAPFTSATHTLFRAS